VTAWGYHLPFISIAKFNHNFVMGSSLLLIDATFYRLSGLLPEICFQLFSFTGINRLSITTVNSTQLLAHH